MPVSGVVVVTVTFAAPVDVSTELVPTLQVTPVGAVHVKEKTPLNSAIGVAVNENLADCPATTVTLRGAAVREKSGAPPPVLTETAPNTPLRPPAIPAVK
jgi:hypothetical protein